MMIIARLDKGSIELLDGLSFFGSETLFLSDNVNIA